MHLLGLHSLWQVRQLYHAASQVSLTVNILEHETWPRPVVSLPVPYGSILGLYRILWEGSSQAYPCSKGIRGPLTEKKMAAVERLWARPSILSPALRLLQIQNKTVLVVDLPLSHRRHCLLSLSVCPYLLGSRWCCGNRLCVCVCGGVSERV